MRIKFNHFFYLLLGLVGFEATPAMAAQDIFLCIEGLEGETADARHPGCMDVLAWSWGASNSGDTQAGGGGGAGKVSFQDLSVTKYVDKASPDIMQHTANGTVYPKLELLIHKPCLECKVSDPYYTLTIQLPIVSSVSTGGSAGEDRLIENVSFNFAKIEWCYSPQKQDGSLDPPICGDWDAVSNTRL